ncbi:ORF124 [Agrotis segetum granulovirus]|uniref:ORF124 n=1 Tax=Agrotis segetum granulosis virus TaxID=10464 RepID=Q6QXI4_GVAS|nr:ORF124 [Agrotis segetum granulovirus]
MSKKERRASLMYNFNIENLREKIRSRTSSKNKEERSVTMDENRNTLDLDISPQPGPSSATVDPVPLATLSYRDTEHDYSLAPPSGPIVEPPPTIPDDFGETQHYPMTVEEAKNFDAVNAVLRERDVFELESYVKRALAPTITVDGQPIDPSKVFVAKAPHLPENRDLAMVQLIATSYINEIMGLNETVYTFVQSSAGDRAVGYLYFARLLYENGLNTNVPAFLKCCDAMRAMYNSWADQVERLFPLILNLNGFDVVKETMNIVNQSVYRLVTFVLASEGVSSPKLFYRTALRNASDVYDGRDELETRIIRDQQLLTNLYDERFFNASKAKNVYKFYKEEKETPTFNLGHIKLYKLKVAPHQFNKFEIMRTL